jgi:hypothetical protein
MIAGPAIFAPETGVAAAGTAVVVAAALLPTPLLLLRAPRLWSVSVLAPALGMIGLAGAFPAVAGRAWTWLERAAVGALGAWWLLLAEPLADQRLLLGPAPGATTGDSAQEAVTIAAESIADTMASGLPALLALWAAAAAILPILVRGRSLTFDVIAASAWTAGLASATATLGEALDLGEPRGLIAGAVVAGAIAVIEPRYSHHEND